MSGSQNNVLITLYRSGKTTFRLNEIALLTGLVEFDSLNQKIHYLVKKGELLNLRKGIYALSDYSKQELASKIFTPSYLSLDYVLQKEGVIFQYDSSFTSVSYLSRAIEIEGTVFRFRKIKNEILVNNTGIILQNDGVCIATKERAFLDYIYLNGESYIDNPSILDKKSVNQLLPIFNSQSLTKRVAKIIEDV
jgi:hypothetical protein